MNRTSPDSERPPASEPVWERPWSVEEIRRSSQNWSLAADAGLLQFLQEFSQQTISRTHEIKKQVDGLIQETKATHCRLHNVFNDFLMLSNTQFIENRVYDEEVEEQVLKAEAEKAEQEKTREQKEIDLIPKVQEAVNYGLQVLDSAFEQLDIKAGNSDSEEDILFPPPTLTDEDFSPFGSRGGLFSNGQGLFDDEDESDLFKEAPRARPAQAPVSEELPPSPKPGKKIPAGAVSVLLGHPDVSGSTSAPSLKELQKHGQPTPGKSSHLPTPAGLFDDDDNDNDEDDNNFFMPSSSLRPLFSFLIVLLIFHCLLLF